MRTGLAALRLKVVRRSLTWLGLRPKLRPERRTIRQADFSPASARGRTREQTSRDSIRPDPSQR